MEETRKGYRSEVRINTRKSRNGIVMDEEMSKKAFEPLFTTRARETGLGLSLVRKIVEELGGTVSLESALDQGTKVSVVLHMAQG